MKNKKSIILISVIVLIAIIVALVLILSSNDNSVKVEVNKVNGADVTDKVNNTSGEDGNTTSEITISEAEMLNADVEVFARANKLDVIKAGDISEEILADSGEAGLQIINLAVSKAGFSPREFKVKPGQVITINLGATDDETHAFSFVEEGMLSSSVTVTGGYSLGFSFVAPQEPGVINFFDEKYPDNKGKMIVE